MLARALTSGNYWQHYGGIDQYNYWSYAAGQGGVENIHLTRR
jgi:hypothetical protein